jgi:hypothetical protein
MPRVITRLIALALLSVALASCQGTPESVAAPVAFTQPILTPVLYHGQERYQGSKDWTWHRHGRPETVPAGLLVDGASVPRPVWWFLPPDGLHRAAAYAHDWCYILRGKLRNGEVLTRAEADEVFYNLMIEGGVSKPTAAIAHRAVRSFGWMEWRRPYVGPTIAPVQSVLLAPRAPQRTRLFKHLYAP